MLGELLRRTRMRSSDPTEIAASGLQTRQGCCRRGKHPTDSVAGARPRERIAENRLNAFRRALNVLPLRSFGAPFLQFIERNFRPAQDDGSSKRLNKSLKEQALGVNPTLGERQVPRVFLPRWPYLYTGGNNY
jgi:hypothetical protein